MKSESCDGSDYLSAPENVAEGRLVTSWTLGRFPSSNSITQFYMLLLEIIPQ